MSRKYFYSTTISNNYLNKFREIKGATWQEVEFKAAEQHRKWDEQEKRQRERENIADLKSQAEFDTQKAKELIDNYNKILKSTLTVDDKLNWDLLKKKDHFDTFTYNEIKPNLGNIFNEINVPSENKILELIDLASII